VIDIPLQREPNDGMLTLVNLKKCHCMLVIVNISVSPARNNFPGGSACFASETNWYLATRILVTQSAALLGGAETCVLYIQKVSFQLLIYFLFRIFFVITLLEVSRAGLTEIRYTMLSTMTGMYTFFFNISTAGIPSLGLPW